MLNLNKDLERWLVCNIYKCYYMHIIKRNVFLHMFQFPMKPREPVPLDIESDEEEEEGVEEGNREEAAAVGCGDEEGSMPPLPSLETLFSSSEPKKD